MEVRVIRILFEDFGQISAVRQFARRHKMSKPAGSYRWARYIRHISDAVKKVISIG